MAAVFLADGAPTGLAAVDVAGRAAVGGGGVLLATSAGPTVVLLAAVGAAVGAVGSSVQVLAFAAAGVVLLAMRRRVDSSLASAVGGGALVMVAMHLDDADVLPNPWMAAAWALAPIVVWGLARLPGRQQRLVARGSLVIGCMAAFGGALGLVAALSAKSSLDAGLAAANQGLEAARRADGPQAAARLADAKRAFADASRNLSAWWARPAEGVPVVAQQLRMLRVASDSGRQLSAVGARAIGSAELQRIVVLDGRVPLERVRSIEGSVGQALEGLRQARRQLATADSPWLLPPLGRRLDVQRARLAAAEASGRRAQRALHQLPALLGADGPRRYFLAVQTPSEMRGSGGIIGNYGEITAEDGRLRLARFGRTADLNFFGDPESRSLVAPDDYVARWARFSPETIWQNVTMSPDFPSVAKVIANLYQQSGGAPIDGVIAVDPSTIAALLRVVGPVSVPAWPEPLTPDNAERILLHEQYLRLEGDARVGFLGATVEELWRRLTTGSLPGAGDVVSALGPAARGKHLLLASTRGNEERLFRDVGVAGAMAPVDGDFLAVVAQNAGENKIDWFLRRRSDYRVELDPATGRVKARLEVVLRNDAPREGLPLYVIGNPPDTPVPPGDNRLYLSVYTPWVVDRARIAGAEANLEPATELERRVFSTFVVVPAGGSLTVELEMSGHLDHAGTYRLDLHRQPGITPEEVVATVALRPSGSSPSRGRAPSTTRRFDLDTDRTIEVPLAALAARG